MNQIDLKIFLINLGKEKQNLERKIEAVKVLLDEPVEPNSIQEENDSSNGKMKSGKLKKEVENFILKNGPQHSSNIIDKIKHLSKAKDPNQSIYNLLYRNPNLVKIKNKWNFRKNNYKKNTQIIVEEIVELMKEFGPLKVKDISYKIKKPYTTIRNILKSNSNTFKKDKDKFWGLKDEKQIKLKVEDTQNGIIKAKHGSLKKEIEKTISSEGPKTTKELVEKLKHISKSANPRTVIFNALNRNINLIKKKKKWEFKTKTYEKNKVLSDEIIQVLKEKGPLRGVKIMEKLGKRKPSIYHCLRTNRHLFKKDKNKLWNLKK